MKICVVGLGYVGSVLAPGLASAGHEVVAVDSVEEKVNGFLNGKLSIYEPGIPELVAQYVEAGTLQASSNLEDSTKDADIAFVCVGTPIGANGRLDLGQVNQVCARLAVAWRKCSARKIIAIRSTVDPGTCERIQNSINQYLNENESNATITVVYIPEFLREGTAISDYYNPPFLIIGLLPGAETYLDRQLSNIFLNVNCLPSFQNIRTAEMMKYVCNTWHALKVVFANEIGTFCEKLSINSEDLMSLFKRDTVLNISEAYLTPGGPYGGSCLPKDVSGLLSLAKSNNINLDVIGAISKSNEKTHQNLFEALLDKSEGKPLLIYGLSFKAGTDDIRNSPAYALAQYLSTLNYTYAWYDIEISNVMERHSLSSSFSMLLDPNIKALMTVDPIKYILENNAITVFGKNVDTSFQHTLEELKLKWFSLAIPSLLR